MTAPTPLQRRRAAFRRAILEYSPDHATACAPGACRCPLEDFRRAIRRAWTEVPSRRTQTTRA